MKCSSPSKVFVLLTAVLMFGVPWGAAAEEAAAKKVCSCCGGEEEGKQSPKPKRKRAAKTRTSGDCVCPQWKYAEFPSYYSYYSQLCPEDGEAPYWVGYDTATDHGEFPNSYCEQGSPPSCTNCVTVLKKKKKYRTRGRHEVSPALRRTTGIPANVARDYEPDTVSGAEIEESFVAKVRLPLGGTLFAKLFVFVVDPPGPAPPERFGHGVQTKRQGGHDIVIQAADVELVEEGEPATKCFRFETDDASVVSELTSFQVITRRAIPTGH